MRNHGSRHHVKLLIGVLAIVVAVLIAGGLLAGPISDNLTLANADPMMIKLAQQAGMSRQGELIFLRAHPQLVSDTQMETECASNTAANNSNGFIEQGCYDPSANRIYIRQLPADLYNLEISTAAYEMLHPVYISLHSSSQGPTLDKAIEANYAAINDANLNAQVANFAKTEPSARDLELFSLLGTGYSNLANNLANYYAPYFNNIGLTMAANNQVKQLFQNDENQLDQIQATINKDDQLANTAYADSVSWAEAGNQYEDDRNYNIYTQDIAAENAAVNQYNQVLQSYNALVTEFNGTQPVQQIQTTQTQSQ